MLSMAVLPDTSLMFMHYIWTWQNLLVFISLLEALTILTLAAKATKQEMRLLNLLNSHLDISEAPKLPEDFFAMLCLTCIEVFLVSLSGLLLNLLWAMLNTRFFIHLPKILCAKRCYHLRPVLVVQPSARNRLRSDLDQSSSTGVTARQGTIYKDSMSMDPSLE